MAFNTLMHDRNIYKERPDFAQISLDYPELRKFALPNSKGKFHIDFTSPEALRTVTKILLKKDFDLSVDIPTGFLIPTVPQRLNYILWIEDLLNMLPSEKKTVSGIDIGTGPCAIFSLLGAKKNSWQFVSTETSDEAIEWAIKNIKVNNLESKIEVLKVNKDGILKEVLSTNDHKYDFCLCNPPFFGSIDEIRRKHPYAKETIATFAKESEIFSEGGEVIFVKRLIKDSLIFKDRICLFTSMFGKKKSFVEILKELESMPDVTYTKTEFCQGNTVRWGLAWSFLKGVNFQQLKKPMPKKPKKAKPPLSFLIPMKQKSCTIENLSQQIQNILLELEIQFYIVKCFPNYTEIQITADKNTWSYQRRKRRNLMKDESKNSCATKCSASSSSDSKLSNENIKSECNQSTENNIDICEQLISDTSNHRYVHQPDLNVKVMNDVSLIGEDMDSTNTTIDKSEVKISEQDKLESFVPKDINNAESTINKFETNTSEQDKLDSNVTKLTEVTKPNCPLPIDTAIKTNPCTEISLSDKAQDYKTSDISVNENLKVTNNNDSMELLSHKRKLESDGTESSKKTKLDLNFLSEHKDSLPGMITAENDESEYMKSDKQKKFQLFKNKKLNSKSKIIDANFSPKSLLYCCLKLRKGSNDIKLELNCPPGANRDSMYQIFQLLKNKLIF